MGTKLRFDQVLDSQFASQQELDNALSSGLISNPGAENDTSGWSASGANFTISRTTDSTKKRKGTASFELIANGSQTIGDYIYINFTIPNAYKNRLLLLSFFYYSVSFISDDCRVVIHDGTNEILPNLTMIPSGHGKFVAYFVTNSNLNYSLRFKANTTNSFDFVIDEVIVDDFKTLHGAAISDFHPDTGFSFSSGFGVVTGVEVYSSRVGDTFVFEGRGVSGTVTASQGYILLPGGMSIDYTKYTTTKGTRIGYLTQLNNTTNYIQNSVLFVDGSTTDRIFICYTQTTGDYAKDNVSAFLSSSTEFSIGGQIHITNWSSNIELSSERTRYTSNSSSSDATDTSSFLDGPHGSPVPALTNAYYKRVRSPYPITSTTDVTIEIDRGGIGKWKKWEHWYDNVNGGYGPTWTYFSDYEIDVWMRGTHYAYFDDASASSITYTAANAAGDRWRVRFANNPLAVQTPDQYRELIVTHEETTSTDGGTFTSGSWQTLPANTIVYDGIGGITVSSNEINNLPPGDYEVTASHRAYDVASAKMRVYDVTNSSPIKEGESCYMTVTASGNEGSMTLFHRFTITSQISLRFEAQCSSTRSPNGLGVSTGFGSYERYGTYIIRRMNPV